MTDIVEWLRDKSSEHNMYRCEEAADEIERLRAKMQEIYDLHHNNAYDVFLRDDTTYEIACEALGLKDD